ncbi:MAG: YggT family protein [Acidimicrobiales bacterium]
MLAIQNLIRSLLQLYVIVIIVSIVLSYFPATPESGLFRAQMALRRITEPVFAPIRRLVPRIGGGGMMFDFTPLIVILLIQYVLIPII